MREIPPDELEPGPAGTPPSRRALNRAPAWCVAHRVRWDWVPAKGHYAAEDELAGKIPGHEVEAVDVGAIPCGETTGIDPDEFPHAGPWALTPPPTG